MTCINSQVKGSVKGISGNVDMSAEPSEKFKELIFSAELEWRYT